MTDNRCQFRGISSSLAPAYVLGLGILGLCLMFPLESEAQDARAGIAPSDSTQRAVSDSPTTSGSERDGLYASVGVAYARHSNVRRDSVLDGGGESDSAVVITPQASYKRGFGRHSAELGVTSQFTRYDDLEDENTETYTIDGLTNLDVTRIVDLDLYGSYTETADPRGGSGTRLIQDPEPDELEITRYGGVVTVGRRASRMQIEAGADQSRWRYQNNQQEFRDRDEDRIYGRVYYNISPRTSVFVGGSLVDVDFIRPGTDLDSEETSYEVGVRWDVSAKTTGRISVGRTEKDFDAPALEDADTTTLAGKLTWSARPRTTVNLYGSRQFEESADLGGDGFFVSELIGLSVDQSFGSRWNAFGYINRTDDDFDNGRTDEILDYGVGLDYSLRRWLTIGAQYSVVERDSNVAGNDFEDEIVTLFLNGSFEVAR